MHNIDLDEYCLITHTPNTLFSTALPLVASAQKLLRCKSEFQPEDIHTQATPSLDLLSRSPLQRVCVLIGGDSSPQVWWETWLFIHICYTHRKDNVYASCRNKMHIQAGVTLRSFIRCQSIRERVPCLLALLCVRKTLTVQFVIT